MGHGKPIKTTREMVMGRREVGSAEQRRKESGNEKYLIVLLVVAVHALFITAPKPYTRRIVHYEVCF